MKQDLENEIAELYTQVTVRLHAMIGACRLRRITKGDISESLENFIAELERQQKERNK